MCGSESAVYSHSFQFATRTNAAEPVHEVGLTLALFPGIPATEFEKKTLLQGTETCCWRCAHRDVRVSGNELLRAPAFSAMCLQQCLSEPPLRRNLCSMNELKGPDFSSHQLIPAIAQDVSTGDVLMMAWMNQEAWEETLTTGRVCYFSRSRNKLWRKGEESGNVQELHSAFFDCDGDTLLLKVRQIGGAACHEGFRSCFFRQVHAADRSVTVEGTRVFNPASVYGK